MEMKIFTLEEANKLIPVLRPKLETIKSHYIKIQSYNKEAKTAANSAQFGGGGIQDGQLYAKLLFEFEQLIDELHKQGVQLKDYSTGLIDFPYMFNGKIVLLCWKLGESDKIKWWHDINAGFRGRTPL